MVVTPAALSQPQYSVPPLLLGALGASHAAPAQTTTHTCSHPQEFMPQLNRHLADSGLQLRNFLISTAACCPSRSILMTGRYTHNNNVTSNIEPHGAGSVRTCGG